MRRGWPLLGLEEPDMPARVPYAPGEFAALAAWRKDAAAIEEAMGGGASSSGGGGGDHSKIQKERGAGCSGAPGGGKGGQAPRGLSRRSDAAAGGRL